MTTHVAVARRMGATMIAFTMAAAILLMVGNTASAAIVPTVPLATSANYAVLAGSTVTNTLASVINGSVGLSPGSSITGFPPGIVVPPGVIDNNNAAAAQAQSDLTTAYVDALGRPTDGAVPADLANQHLGAGVYATSGNGALQLTGPLVLDGAGDPSSVFIFQTNSTLITASGSTVTLINGAQECNVFWQVGSSATLGTGSVFSGNILALTSITVTTGVTVHGRALARNGAVTLDTDTFTKPTCATSAGGGGRRHRGRHRRGAGGAGGGDTTTTTTPGTAIDLTSSGGPGVPGVAGPPKTGGAPLRSEGFPWSAVLVATLLGGVGTVGEILRRRAHSRGAAAGGALSRPGSQ